MNNNNKNFSRTNLSKNNALEIGDIMIGRLASVGNVGVILEIDCVASCNCVVYRSKYPLNIKASVLKQQKQLVMKATGAVQQLVNKEDIFKLFMIETYIGDEEINSLYLKLLAFKCSMISLKNIVIKLLIKQ
jgi:hypothetical protein